MPSSTQPPSTPGVSLQSSQEEIQTNSSGLMNEELIDQGDSVVDAPPNYAGRNFNQNA